MDGFCQCMLVLEKLRDNYASADFATQFLEAAIRKADIDVMMRNSNHRMRHDNAKATEMQHRSRAARRTTPPSDEHGIDIDLQSSGMVDIGIPVGRPDNLHNAISARTPDSENAVSGDQFGNSNMNGMEFPTMGNSLTGDVDLNDFLTFDNGNELWNVPLEEGAHGESGGFMGDMTWIDQAPGWSRLNSPLPEVVQPDGQDLFGNNASTEARPLA